MHPCRDPKAFGGLSQALLRGDADDDWSTATSMLFLDAKLPRHWVIRGDYLAIRGGSTILELGKMDALIRNLSEGTKRYTHYWQENKIHQFPDCGPDARLLCMLSC